MAPDNTSVNQRLNGHLDGFIKDIGDFPLAFFFFPLAFFYRV